MRAIKGMALVEFMLSQCLGLILCAAAVTYLQQIVALYLQTQRKLTLQTTTLLARHYLAQDLINASSAQFCTAKSTECASLLTKELQHLQNKNLLKTNSSLLLLNTLPIATIYYLRTSAIPNNQGNFALYRDPITSRAQTLVEHILNFTVQSTHLDMCTQQLNVQVEFKDNSILEMTCLYKKCKAMS